eukprot:1957856-Pyramimonas_sp.AAC.1
MSQTWPAPRISNQYVPREARNPNSLKLSGGWHPPTNAVAGNWPRPGEGGRAHPKQDGAT